MDNCGVPLMVFLTCCVILIHGVTSQSLGQLSSSDKQDIISTTGQEFVFNFPAPSFTQKAILLISTSSDETVSVAVTVPGIGIRIKKNVTRSQHAEVYLEMPFSHQQLISAIQNKTIIVKASHDVTVIGISDDFKIGSFLALPSRALGKQYYVSSFHESSANFYSGFSISSVSDGTNIKIRPDTGDSIHVQIDAYQTIQIHDGYNDLSGWFVEANKPIAVMAGTVEIGKPWGDPRGFSMLEQLPSIDNYGLTFDLAPFLPLYDYSKPMNSGNEGYQYRVIASQNTTITIRKPGGYRTVELRAGEVYRGSETEDAITSITSDKPVLVAQYMNPFRDTNDLYDDSAMVIVPATEMFASDVTFPVYCIFLPNQKVYINIIIQCSQANGLIYDGTMQVSDWDFISYRDKCAYRSEITCGTHGVKHVDPNAAFSVTVYWFGDKYGFANTVGHKVKANAAPLVPQPETTSPHISTLAGSTSSGSTPPSTASLATTVPPVVPDASTKSSLQSITSLPITTNIRHTGLTTSDATSNASGQSGVQCKSSPVKSEQHGKSNTIFIALVAILGLVILCLIIVIIVVVKRKQRCYNCYDMPKSIRLSDQHELMPKLAEENLYVK